VIIEDLVERIVAENAGTVGHGVHPAKVKEVFGIAARQD
jgi:hypothetical protein